MFKLENYKEIIWFKALLPPKIKNWKKPVSSLPWLLWLYAARRFHF